jgi:hypothetical protein
MSQRPHVAASRASPPKRTAGDTRQLFENAGSNADPIPIQNESHALRELEVIITQINRDDDWTVQNDGINRMMRLINGGLLQFDPVVRDLKRLSGALVSASRNMRSALVKSATLLLAQLSRALGDRFDVMGEVVLPLSAQTSHGTQFIADCCKHAIIEIASNCQTKRVLKSVINLSNSRSVANRRLAAEALAVVLRRWRRSIVDSNILEITATLARLGADSQADVRQAAREASPLVSERKSGLSMSADRQRPSRVSMLPTRARRPSPSPPRAPIPLVFLPSPIARRAQFPKPRGYLAGANIQLTDGHEAEFLDRIEEYINTNRPFELKDDIVRVAPLLVKCARHTHPVRARALTAIEELLPEFPEAFESSLSLVINVLWGSRFVFTLHAFYHPNAILKIVIGLEHSQSLLELVAILCSQPEISLGEPGLNVAIIDIVLAHRDCEVAAKRVIHAINRQTPSLLAACHNDFLKSILRQPEDGFPSFNPANPSQWCSDMKFCLRTSRQWDIERNNILREIALAAEWPTAKNFAFGLMIDVLKSKGSGGWQVLFDSLLAHFREKQSPNVQALWKCLVADIQHGELVDHALRAVSQANPELARNAIDIVAEIVLAVHDAGQLRQCVEQIAETLRRALASESAEVRRAAVLCYVALLTVFGPELNPILERLTQPQQRLVAYYYQQKGC